MVLADLHIHSKYSRATSRNADLPNLDFWARRKGITLLGTGDFTHPAYREEMRECLTFAEEGLYRLKPEFSLPDFFGGQLQPRFVLSAEISCIYKQDGKVRKVHNVILLPSLEKAEELSQKLAIIGNVHSDGRPILGLSSRDLLEITLQTCESAIFIPAHIWTPHFSLLGAFSGFDSLSECFGDLTPYVRAVETGLSSDPPMNWRVPVLKGLTLVSNSDAHSPAKIAREANLLECALSYPNLKRALNTGEGFLGTVEFFPEEGKYHLDGHRNCKLCLSPAETKELGGICPVCGKKITVGVLSRVNQLSAFDEGYKPQQAKLFEHLMPLTEVISASLGVSESGERTQRIYEKLLKSLGDELHILREAGLEDVRRVCGENLAEGLSRLRSGKIIAQGGFDGEYGKIALFSPKELSELKGQITFFLPEKGKPQQLKTQPIAAEFADDQNAFTPAKQAVQAVKEPRYNAEQAKAIGSNARVTAVLAGPGTGKTFTLTERVAELIERRCVSPDEITAVTFTNQAAAEMRMRLKERLTAAKAADRMQLGTFHAVCLRLLRQANNNIVLIDRANALTLAEKVTRDNGLKLTPGRFLQAVSARKNSVLDPKAESDAQASDALNAAILDYGNRLKGLGALDFDDLLTKALNVDLADERCFTHLLVDEYQDVNPLQRLLVEKWHNGGAQGKNGSLFVIGDADQSIYGFRGASAECFQLLKRMSPDLTEIRLLRNYRSTPQIVNAATHVISHNVGTQRRLTACAADGAPVRIVYAEDEPTEGSFVAKEIARMTGGLDMLSSQAAVGRGERPVRSFSDVAVLCRTHREAENIEKCLHREDIPCTVTGKEAYLDSPDVRGVLGFFRYLLNPVDTVSLKVCLSCLFPCPAELIDWAANVAQKEKSATLAAEKLAAYPSLTPFANAVNAFAAKIKKERTHALLESFAAEHKLASDAVLKLLDATTAFPAIKEFLQNLLLGEEADFKRGSKKTFSAGAVKIMTLHAAKGLEFRVVFLCGLSKGRFPSEKTAENAEQEEERRLFFVGMTRAKEDLYLLTSSEPSPFLAELPQIGVSKEQAYLKKRNPSKQLSMF